MDTRGGTPESPRPVTPDVLRGWPLPEKAQADIDESKAEIERIEGEVATLQADMEEELSALTESWTEAAEKIEEVKVAPRKSDIDVHLVALAWAPSWEVSYEDLRGLQRTESVLAYSVSQQA